MANLMIALSALLLSLYVLPADGVLTCQVRGKGKLSAYTSQKVKVRIPCKYEATTVHCQGYRLHVAPTQDVDSKARYYTKTVWVGITKTKTDFHWQARTTAKRVLRFFNGTETDPFRVKSDLNKAPAELKVSSNPKAHSVTVEATDADWKVVFYAYEENSKQRRKGNGIQIVCPEAEFPADELNYPKSICGNSSDGRSVRDRKKELGLKDRTQTIIYDILDANMTQFSAPCEVATHIFQKKCGSVKNRVSVLQVCSPILTSSNIMKCLHKYSYHAMEVFLQCLKYKCRNDWDACDLLQDAMKGCPALKISSKC